MKILQLNNTASVPLTLARYLRVNNSYYDVDVLHPIFGQADADHIRGVDDVIIIDGNPKSITEWIAKNSGIYDLIHVHAILEYLPLIRKFNSTIPIIFTGHGTNVREKWHQHKMLNLVNKITVSTKDLLDGSPKGTYYIPNTPDPSVWIRKNKKPIEKLALYKYFGRPIYDVTRIEKEAKAYASANRLELHKQDRSGSQISNMVYPRYLEIYKTFIDFKYLTPKMYKNVYFPLSYTALQFLSLGDNKVVHHSGEYTELPAEYEYDTVMNQWSELYYELLGC